MASRPMFIQTDNLSVAWTRAFLALLEPGVDDLIPLVVNLSGFSRGAPAEIPAIRAALDTRLDQNERTYRSATTAGLIFPENLWLRYRGQGRTAFFQHYLDVLFPRLQRADRRNARGTYFERMLAYGPKRKNQLAHVIDTRLGGNKRRSALQVMVFDPELDHSNRPYLDFPCLDHVAFAPDGDGGLSLTAFYAMQYIFDRAYGNYLGLCALGRFVAGELGLEFRQLTCVAGIAQLGGIKNKRGSARELAEVIKAALPPALEDGNTLPKEPN